jgi:hypothetical protein
MDASRRSVDDVRARSALPPGLAGGLPDTLEELLASLLFASICGAGDTIVVMLNDERRELALLTLQLN